MLIKSLRRESLEDGVSSVSSSPRKSPREKQRVKRVEYARQEAFAARSEAMKARTEATNAKAVARLCAAALESPGTPSRLEMRALVEAAMLSEDAASRAEARRVEEVSLARAQAEAAADERDALAAAVTKMRDEREAAAAAFRAAASMRDALDAERLRHLRQAADAVEAAATIATRINAAEARAEQAETSHAAALAKIADLESRLDAAAFFRDKKTRSADPTRWFAAVDFDWGSRFGVTLGVDEAGRAVVEDVTRDGRRSGLKRGDVVVAIGHRDVSGHRFDSKDDIALFARRARQPSSPKRILFVFERRSSDPPSSEDGSAPSSPAVVRRSTVDTPPSPHRARIGAFRTAEPRHSAGRDHKSGTLS